MKRTVAAVAALAVVGLMFWLWILHAQSTIRLDTPYQAVLLDNGQFLYGKLERPNSDFPVLTDVYYVQQQVNPQTKEVKSILVRRGSEWHGPNRTVLNARHIIMVEPVTKGSKVSQLIEALKAKNP